MEIILEISFKDSSHKEGSILHIWNQVVDGKEANKVHSKFKNSKTPCYKTQKVSICPHFCLIEHDFAQAQNLVCDTPLTTRCVVYILFRSIDAFFDQRIQHMGDKWQNNTSHESAINYITTTPVYSSEWYFCHSATFS